MNDDIWDEIIDAAVDGAKLWIRGIIVAVLLAAGLALWG